MEAKITELVQPSEIIKGCACIIQKKGDTFISKDKNVAKEKSFDVRGGANHMKSCMTAAGV